ncbi:MAG: serine/threonine-protein phosphatase, partial [Actinobacteria bacterium]|nr:serine/threonine-protein phosphatase [Actinomycetota bacterium]
MRLQAGVASDRGLVRSANEDSFLLRRGLYAVCDGMGGARGGEVASQMACLGLLGLNPETAGQRDLCAAISSANQAIAHRGAGEAHLLGMGTTLTAILVKEGHLTLAHVGDSRAYILHSGELTQLTEDHSWVGEMVRRGELTPEQAAVHPHRSVIT